jgi:hypothetical protein
MLTYIKSAVTSHATRLTGVSSSAPVCAYDPQLAQDYFGDSAVPWTLNRYPISMKNLSPAVREKAIVIANALLDEGYPEDRCIRIAIARAKEWALRQGLEQATAYRSSWLH